MEIQDTVSDQQEEKIFITPLREILIAILVVAILFGLVFAALEVQEYVQRLELARGKFSS